MLGGLSAGWAVCGMSIWGLWAGVLGRFLAGDGLWAWVVGEVVGWKKKDHVASAFRGMFFTQL